MPWTSCEVLANHELYIFWNCYILHMNQVAAYEVGGFI